MSDDDLLELYLERAAIREYLGHLPRREAEQAAYRDWRQLVGSRVRLPDAVRRILENKPD